MHEMPNRWGVLIADVVQSRGVADLRATLSEKLRSANAAHLREGRVKLPYAITAGDEFQTVATRPKEIPSLIFDLRRRLYPLALRIGVGIGEIAGRVRPPANALGGDAFQLARQAIEDLKSRGSHRFAALTAFHSRNERFDIVANLVYGLHDTLIQDISEKQWQAMNAYLVKRRVDLTARALGVSVSTASRNLKRAHFWEILETIERMEKILENSFS